MRLGWVGLGWVGLGWVKWMDALVLSFNGLPIHPPTNPPTHRTR